MATSVMRILRSTVRSDESFAQCVTIAAASYSLTLAVLAIADQGDDSKALSSSRLTEAKAFKAFASRTLPARIVARLTAE